LPRHQILADHVQSVPHAPCHKPSRGTIEYQSANGRGETDRIEAFGVFAIAITLLILDIKVPHQSSSSLLVMLLNLWPAYFAYILSFVSARRKKRFSKFSK
jgi:hypothetical protein